MELTQPDLLCPRCGAPIPSNRDRDVAELTRVLKREPTQAELDSMPPRRRKMGLMGCEACFKRVAVPREKKGPVEDTQMPIVAPGWGF